MNENQKNTIPPLNDMKIKYLSEVDKDLLHVKNIRPSNIEKDWEGLAHRLVFVIESLKKNPLDIEQWNKVFFIVGKYEDMCRD